MWIKLLAHSRFPTRQQILERLQKKFGSSDFCLNALLTPCAEEAERIINEIWLDMAQRGEGVSTISIKADFQGDRCTCPNCYQRSIFRLHNYCPKCGSRIIWTNQ